MIFDLIFATRPCSPPPPILSDVTCSESQNAVNDKRAKLSSFTWKSINKLI